MACAVASGEGKESTDDGFSEILHRGEQEVDRGLSCLIEAVRDQTRIVDLKQVNPVLIQPHVRKNCDSPIH